MLTLSSWDFIKKEEEKGRRKMVSHNSFPFPVPVRKRSDRAGAEAALLGPGRSSHAGKQDGSSSISSRPRG